MRIIPRFVPFAVAAILTWGVGNASAGAILAESTFDADIDGWIAITVAAPFTPIPVTFAAGAGNPGGALRHDAPSDSDTSFFVAPGKFVPALHSAVGGSIEWDVSTLHSAADTFFSTFADIAMNAVVGADVWRIRLHVTPPAPPDHPAYAHYDVDFDTSEGWLLSINLGPNAVATQAQIDTVLAGASLRPDGQAALFIRAEYFSSATPDTAFLDNVRVRNAVPLPASLWLVIAAVALGLARNRFSP